MESEWDWQLSRMNQLKNVEQKGNRKNDKQKEYKFSHKYPHYGCANRMWRTNR
jgi:hypothetical protein